NIESLQSLFKDFKSYLVYRGRGIPRRIISAFNEFVRWEDGSPNLRFTRQEIRRIHFFALLNNALMNRRPALLDNPGDEPANAYIDKKRLGIFYLIDWILHQSLTKFTLHDAANACRLLSSKISLRDEIAPDIIKQVFDLMAKTEYVRQVQNPEDQTLAGGIDSQSVLYELVPRRLAEMGSTEAFEIDSSPLTTEPSPGTKFGHYLLTRE